MYIWHDDCASGDRSARVCCFNIKPESRAPRHDRDRSVGRVVITYLLMVALYVELVDHPGPVGGGSIPLVE